MPVFGVAAGVSLAVEGRRPAVRTSANFFATYGKETRLDHRVRFFPPGDPFSVAERLATAEGGRQRLNCRRDTRGYVAFVFTFYLSRPLC
jgi:hypothetical protein